jgi:hypothetical protein
MIAGGTFAILFPNRVPYFRASSGYGTNRVVQ